MGKDLKGKELGVGISQRKDGRYVGRFTDRFGARPEFKSYQLSEVKDAMAKAMYEDQQKLNIRTAEMKMTLDEWYKKWLDIHKYGLIKENTKAGYINHYKKHIHPNLGKFRLVDITQLQIKELLKNMDKAGYGFEMKNRTRIMLLDMFGKAMQDEIMARNPAKGIKIVRDEEVEPRVLTKEEQSIFFDCCKGTFYDNLFVVCVNTGLRPGEACALMESDIDFEKKQLSVSKTLIYQKWEDDSKKTIHIDTPKTKKSIRKIPLNTMAILALKKQFVQKEVLRNRYGTKYCDERFKDLLFTTKFNTPVIEQTFIDAIDRIIDEINSVRDIFDEFERITPHCFRHTFATRCIESGMKPKVLQKILGHATLQMTMDLYAHVLPQMEIDEIELLENEMKKMDDMDMQIANERYEARRKQKSKVIELSTITG